MTPNVSAGGEGAEQLDAAEAARIFEGQLAGALLAEDGQLALSSLASNPLSTLMPKLETQGRVGQARCAGVCTQSWAHRRQRQGCGWRCWPNINCRSGCTSLVADGRSSIHTEGTCSMYPSSYSTPPARSALRRWRLVSAPSIPGLLSLDPNSDPTSVLSNLTMGTEVEVRPPADASPACCFIQPIA